jgi:hypothetical protein
MKNAHEFDGLYDDLFDFANAGYVMIDTSSPYGDEYPNAIREFQYVSPDPTKYWMKGIMEKWHVTARGPLDPKVRQKHCKQVLDSIVLPRSLDISDIEIFPSPYPDEPYDCFVVRVEDDALFEINEQLAVLPGVQTYIPYKPHLTLGYFKSGHSDEIMDTFDSIVGFSVDITGWDFGRMEP